MQKVSAKYFIIFLFIELEGWDLMTINSDIKNFKR